MKKIMQIGAVAGATLAASIIFAGAASASIRLCQNTDVTPTADNCQGWDAGNLLGGSPSDLSATATDLNTLLGVTTFNSSNVGGIASVSNLNGTTTISFPGETLFGDTVIGIHVGAATGQANNVGGEATAFFLIDFTSPVTSFTLNVPGSSGATLFSTEVSGSGGGGPIPEPASWALLLMGMGAIGAGLRMQRTRAAFAGL